VLYKIPSISENSIRFLLSILSFTQENAQPRYLKFFTCKHTMILHPTGSCHKNSFVSDSSVNNSITGLSLCCLTWKHLSGNCPLR